GWRRDRPAEGGHPGDGELLLVPDPRRTDPRGMAGCPGVTEGALVDGESEGHRDGVPESTWKRGMAGARTYLHDDLSFVGPFESFQRPEPYLEALGKLHHIVERVEPRRTFVDGDDVCILYDMVTYTPAGTAFICEWYRVRGDKIGSIRAVFDA